MDIRDYLSDDGQAVLALCSSFALSQETVGELEPFKLSEWNELARKIQASSFKSPGEMQGRPATELSGKLGVTLGEAERIVNLLERSGRVALELESLFSRGMWVVTRLDERYPSRLRDSLKHQAPSVLFGAGDITLLQRGGVAVIGSRNIDEAGTTFAREFGRRATGHFPVISGGARGTDRLAMGAALEVGGQAVGVLADSLDRTVRQPDLRQLLLDGQLALVTPYAPSAGFSVGGAMGRNKVIYGLAHFAVVVSSDFQTGGTWAGAVEALKGGWCPVFVRDGVSVPRGNRELQKLGAVGLPEQELGAIENLPVWFNQNARRQPIERDLFE
jgi:DNA processing protein